MHYERFKFSDVGVMKALAESFPFGSIAVNGSSGSPDSAFAPMVFKSEPNPNGSVDFHLSNHNPILSSLKSGAKATITINGPNCPISPSWYKARFPDKNSDRSKTAPTHDYVNATLRGTLQVLDMSKLSRQLGDLVSLSEPPPGQGWQLREIDHALFKDLRSQITGFRMQIEAFDLTAKISQEQQPADRIGIIAGLQARGSSSDVAIAQLIHYYDDNKPAESLIEGLRAISPSGNAVRKNPHATFRRVALSLE